jgi:hypothetical protein
MSPVPAPFWHGCGTLLALHRRYGHEAVTVIPSAVLLVFGVLMGAALIWDLGGFASRMREGLEGQALGGVLYRRLPTWTLRAFGIWCVIFGIGQFFYLLMTAH